MTTTIKPILKYPGAKWNIAEWIISHFPTHNHYLEPYFGSGAVFFNKPPTAHEIINDLSGDVVNLFRVIRDRGTDLAALVEMTPWAREEYEASYLPCDDPIERARRFVIRAQQGHGTDGIRGGKTWSKSQHDRPGWRPRRWHQIPDQIEAIISRIGEAEIDNRLAVDLLCDYAKYDVLIYADPPYPLSTRSGKLYQHEMTDADHMALLDTLDAHPGPVVLSGYHCALYDDRLAHWTTREKRVQAEKGNTRVEVLWLNPVCVERLGYGPMFEAQL